MFAFYWLMPLVFMTVHGPAALRSLLNVPSASLMLPLATGLVSGADHGIVIWAMQSGPMGVISALRETNVFLRC